MGGSAIKIRPLHLRPPTTLLYGAGDKKSCYPKQNGNVYVRETIKRANLSLFGLVLPILPPTYHLYLALAHQTTQKSQLPGWPITQDLSPPPTVPLLHPNSELQLYRFCFFSLVFGIFPVFYSLEWRERNARTPHSSGRYVNDCI